MTLTPLELLLLGSFVSMFTGVAVVFLTRSKFVSCSSCEERHKGERERDDSLRQELQDLRDSMRIQFRMLRAMVLSLPISDEEKRQIINER